MSIKIATLLVTLGAMCIFATPALASETFGVESFESKITSDAEGALATQAGSHPYALTTAITFDHVVTAIEQPPRVRTYGDPKDIEVNLPAGVIVDPRATEARCTEAELESGQESAACPNAAAVGVFSIYLDGIEVIDEPVYNMVSPAGVPAELGFDAAGIGVIMHVGGKVRTGGDYGLSADISGISQKHPIYGLELTLWGDPSAAGHDDERGLCADEEAKRVFRTTGIRGSCPWKGPATPFLTLPSSCSGEELSDEHEYRLLAGTRSPEPRLEPRPERSALADRDIVLTAGDGLRKARLQPKVDGGPRRTGSRGRGIADRARRRLDHPPGRKHRRAGRGGPEGRHRDAARGDRGLALGGRRSRSVHARGDRPEQRERSLLPGRVDPRRGEDRHASARSSARRVDLPGPSRAPIHLGRCWRCTWSPKATGF